MTTAAKIIPEPDITLTAGQARQIRNLLVWANFGYGGWQIRRDADTSISLIEELLDNSKKAVDARKEEHHDD